MSMLDWNAYRKQLATTIGEIGKSAPDLVKGYRALVASRASTGALDAKTRELVALAVAVTVRCDGCIATHVELARRNGATQDEITDALGVAVMVNAGATLVYSARTIDAFHASVEAAGGVGAGTPASSGVAGAPEPGKTT
jgi:AhpD family alkylhydroperoxidase